MSENCDAINRLKLHGQEFNAKLTKEQKICTVSEPSLKFLQLVSIFENEEPDTKLKSLSQRQLTNTGAELQAEEADQVDETDGAEVPSSTNVSDHAPADEAKAVSSGGESVTTPVAYASTTVSVTTNYSSGGNWMGQPGRNLLFVIHPWCMLHKSGVDRQSEFPPPGFLEHLKAKLMALHRRSDEQQRNNPALAALSVRRRRNTNHRIKYWFQYTAAAMGGGGPSTKTSVRAAYPRNEPAAVADFLSVWRRYANAAAACSSVDSG